MLASRRPAAGGGARGPAPWEPGRGFEAAPGGAGRPSVALVSVGEDNSFGHPYPATMAILQQNVGTVLRTDDAGWVSCKVNGDTMVITTERTPTQ